jgi:UDP-N-acetylmuramate dehydrogenase
MTSLITEETRAALVGLLGDRIEFDVPLAKHTALRIGGPADAMATPATYKELARLLALCHEQGLPVRVLGAGFNVLVLESGLRGITLRLKKLRGIERVNESTLLVECGASHATITRFCIDQGLSGLEFGAGIPGTLGGWLAMNAGIGVRELKDVVVAVEILEADASDMRWIPRERLDFGYRALRGLPAGAVLTRAKLRVSRSDRASVQSEIDRLLARRAATQPTDVPSCGSVFRNPPGNFAGRLIEAAGLKGLREGAAEISPVHANFIVNRGGATASDVLELIRRARKAVETDTGIRLETEVQILGDAAPDVGAREVQANPPVPGHDDLEGSPQ